MDYNSGDTWACEPAVGPVTSLERKGRQNRLTVCGSYGPERLEPNQKDPSPTCLPLVVQRYPSPTGLPLGVQRLGDPPSPPTLHEELGAFTDCPCG